MCEVHNALWSRVGTSEDAERGKDNQVRRPPRNLGQSLLSADQWPQAGRPSDVPFDHPVPPQ